VQPIDGTGDARFELAPGNYKLSVSSPGFISVLMPDLEVKPGEHRQFVIVLKVQDCPPGSCGDVGPPAYEPESATLGTLSTPADAEKSDEQSLKVNLKVITRKYCRGEADVGVIWLNLRLQVINRTDRKLIVQKNIGRAWHRTIVAVDEEGLAEGTYEYDPEIMFSLTESEARGPSGAVPGEDFVILEPGKSFEAESFVDVTVATGAPSRLNRDLIRKGNHVLQLKLSTWPYVVRPEPFRDEWKEYGRLVYESVKCEPLPLPVPQDSEFQNCRP